MDVFNRLYGGASEEEGKGMSPLTLTLIVVAVVVLVAVVVYLVWGRKGSATEHHRAPTGRAPPQLNRGQGPPQQMAPPHPQHPGVGGDVGLRMSPTVEEFTYPAREAVLGCNQPKAIAPVTFGHYFQNIAGKPTRAPPLVTELCN